MEQKEKIAALQGRLKALVPYVIAFSAGKDSAFLLRESLRAVGTAGFTAVFIDSPLISEFDRERLAYFQKRFSLTIPVLHLDPLADARIAANRRDRCYDCKKMLFGAILDWMKAQGLPARLLDGSTASDQTAHRPGARAMAELGVLSPLREAGIETADIVAALKAWRVPLRYLTSSSCLATRIPYEEALQPEGLRRIEAMEAFWHKKGIIDVRCRAIEQGCRVEVPVPLLRKALGHRLEAGRRAREIGFAWLALDLEGVRSGPWDDTQAKT
jgi:uncharacterized protein